MRTSLTDRADSETPPVSLRLSGGIIMDVDWSMFLVRPGKRINSMGCFFATRGLNAASFRPSSRAQARQPTRVSTLRFEVSISDS